MSKAISEVSKNSNQWQAMYRHARRFQSTKSTIYVSFRKNIKNDQIIARLQGAQKTALQRGVILFLLSLSD
jgi:predicted RND superfamily exporter protein